MAFKKDLRKKVEARLSRLRGKEVNISGPAYRLVKALAEWTDAERGDGGATIKSFNGMQGTEISIVLHEAERLLTEGSKP